MKLTFTNYRRPFHAGTSTWSEADTKQIEDVCTKCDFVDRLEEFRATPGLDATGDDGYDLLEDLVGMEIVDVVDDAGATLYQILFFDFGTAYMFKAGTTEELGGASQHAFELDESNDVLYAAVGEAYKAANPKIEQMMDF
jgi:hypothetical protein